MTTDQHLDAADPIDPEEFDFDSWLIDAQPAQTSVVILQRPDLLAAYQEWQERWTQASKEGGDIDRDLSQPSALLALHHEGEQLLNELRAARSIWYLRAIDREDEAAIQKAFPLPEAPVRFQRRIPTMADRPTEAQSLAFTMAWTAYTEAKARWEEENEPVLAPWRQEYEDAVITRAAERIARSLVKIEQNGKTARPRLTADQVKELEKRIGQPQIGMLMQAVERVTTQAPSDPEVPAGFLFQD